MHPRIDRIKELMSIRGWSASELARQMEISRSEATRMLNGKRNGGNKVISGLMKAFPNEPLNEIFFLPKMFPNVNAEMESVSNEETSGANKVISVKHPEAHQLACTVNEKDGWIEIKQGKCITTLVISPGPVNIKYSTQN